MSNNPWANQIPNGMGQTGNSVYTYTIPAYQTLPNQVLTTGGIAGGPIWTKPIRIPDLDAITTQLKTESSIQKSKLDLIESLSPHTKNILNIVRELSSGDNLEDILKLDKYVKGALFNNSFETFLNSPDKEETK